MFPLPERLVPQGLIFDSHAHYDDRAFDSDRDELLRALPSAGVCGIISCASGYDSALQNIALSEKYEFIYATAGVHPGDIPADDPDCLPDIDLIAKLALNRKVVAIGEIGLDYFYEDNASKNSQIAWFEAQLALAKDLNLPVIVHDRDAHADIMALLRKYKPAGVVHCFSGSRELCEETVRLGMYVGLGGAATFKNARKPLEIAAAVPVNRLLLETDAPYMTPVPYRGKRCCSAHIAFTAERIAEIRGVDRDDLLRTCRDNTKELFGIK